MNKLALTGIIGAVTLILMLFLWPAFTYSIGGGTVAVIENTLSRAMDVARGPQFGFKNPFFSRVYQYKEVTTLTFAQEHDAETTRNLPAIDVRFADTYTAKINTSFRFKLPANPDGIKNIHLDFRSFDNMVDALFVKNATNTTVVTGMQYTGEEFFQGGINEFKTNLEDQMQHGLFQTRREQVEIEQSGLAPVSSDNTNGNKVEVATQLVWKTVPILDATGKPARQSDPLAKYGVEVTQVTLSGPQPDALLDTLLEDKKRLVGERIRTVQEQETARAQADTEQLKKEIERTRAVQDANRIKELAVIEEIQKVEVERQTALKEIVVQNKQKDLAVINKEKELEISRANEGIQKANAVAAGYEAQAIRETGIANADVLKAKYSALGAFKEIYMAEIQRDISNTLYSNLKDFTVNMPTNMVSMGENGGPSSNLDVLTTFGMLGVMDNVKAKTAPTIPVPAQ